MAGWFAAEGFIPHGFCLTWNPALITVHAASDAAMAASFVACGVVIHWVGRRRPDLAPRPLFLSLAAVFVLCGVVHLSSIATLWFPAYEVQAAVKAIAAISSVVTVSVLAVLAPAALDFPSIAHLREVNARLLQEREEHERTAARLARLARAVEQNPNIIIVTEADGTIEYVNAAFESMTGYPRADVIGRKPSVLAAGTTPRWVYDNLWHTVRGRREWRGELKDCRRDGSEFWVASSIAPLRDENGVIDGFVAIQQDISDRKAAEEEMAVAKRQAEIANRAKSELLANMSHELRTPLNAIIGFSEIIYAEMFGPVGVERYRDYAADIHGSACHLLELINDVLDVSAIEAGKLTLFEETAAIEPLIEASVRLVAPRADQQKVLLEVQPCPSVNVTVDRRRIKQVLINLLTNAIKFTPAGGTVAVAVTLAPEGGLRLTVADTGIGMTEEELEIALQPFGQVDGSLQRRHEGTGLGLPICMGIIERHGGCLHLESEKGRGTTAVMTLPAIRVFATTVA